MARFKRGQTGDEASSAANAPEADRPHVTQRPAWAGGEEGGVAQGGESPSESDAAPAERARPAVVGILIDPNDPANVKTDKQRPNWWLPENVDSWWEIPEPERGSAVKAKALTAEQLMRREREFHLYGRGAGGKHLPDHSARFIAALLDHFLFGAAFILGTRALYSAYPRLLPWVQVNVVVLGGTWVLLCALPLLLWRATPGKLLLGLRLVRVNGDETSAARALGRGIVMLLAPTLIVDVFCVLLSPHRRRLVDYVFGTRVVANG